MEERRAQRVRSPPHTHTHPSAPPGSAQRSPPPPRRSWAFGAPSGRRRAPPAGPRRLPRSSAVAPRPAGSAHGAPPRSFRGESRKRSERAKRAGETRDNPPPPLRTRASSAAHPAPRPGPPRPSCARRYRRPLTPPRGGGAANSVRASPRGPGAHWRSAPGPKSPRRVFIPAARRGPQSRAGDRRGAPGPAARPGLPSLPPLLLLWGLFFFAPHLFPSFPCLQPAEVRVPLPVILGFFI